MSDIPKLVQHGPPRLYDDLALAAAVAMRSLNADAKRDPRHRTEIYQLKDRLTQAFWREGYCIAAELDKPTQWSLVFAVQDYRFGWHLPTRFATFPVRVFSAGPRDLRHYYDSDPERSFWDRREDIRAYLRHVGG